MIKEKTYFEIHELDLSMFVTDFYARPWSMQQGQELGQNTYYTLDVKLADPDNDFLINDDMTECEAEEALANWLAEDLSQYKWDFEFMRNHYLPVEVVLWDLCRKDVISPGSYLILIWW